MPSVFSIQRRATRDAAAAFRKRAIDAQNNLTEQTDRGIGFLQPFQSFGQEALTPLTALLGLGGDTTSALTALENTPGFQFQVDQSNQALNRQLAQQGNLFSGNQLDALARLNQGLAQQRFDTTVGQLQQAAGLGLSAAGQSAGLAQALGGALSDIDLQIGETAANSILKQGDITTGESLLRALNGAPSAPIASGRDASPTPVAPLQAQVVGQQANGSPLYAFGNGGATAVPSFGFGAGLNNQGAGNLF